MLTSEAAVFAALQRVDDWCWRIPRSFRADMRVEVRLFSSEVLLMPLVRELALAQCVNVTTLPGVVEAVVALPDLHQGYGFPIGGVAATRPPAGVISPGGVGFDINCGVRLLVSDLAEGEVRPHLPGLVRGLADAVPAGAGQRGRWRLSDAELTALLTGGLPWLAAKGLASAADLGGVESGGWLPGADAAAVSEQARERGRAQLGTLGSGNHFLEVQRVDRIVHPALAAALGLSSGQVVLMIHTGSRGLGHQVATDHVQAMGPAMRRAGIHLPDRQLACAPVDSPEGRRYVAAMAAASHFAWANRQLVAERARAVFRALFGADLRTLYDVAHNLAREELHAGPHGEETLWVHRKGATRAFPPHHPELPRAYRETGQPVLIPGDMGRASWVLVGAPGALARTFGSVCHGAGRVLSRTAARRQGRCNEIEARLAAQGIIVRGASRHGITEEAPEAYKDVDAVVRVLEGAGLARPVARLVPMGVVKG